MSKTSLAQRNQLKNFRSSIGSGVSITNQQSLTKRYSHQFPLQPHINIFDQLSNLHILQKYLEYVTIKQQPLTYKGEQKNGKNQGFGKYTFSNLDSYIGHWDSSQLHGLGIYSYTSSMIVYIGEFYKNKPHGIGKLIKLSSPTAKQGRLIYQGFYSNGLKSGYGIYFYQDLIQYYQGNWSNNLKHGQGRLFFKQGEFSGNWQMDQRHGQGKLKIQGDITSIYYGQWERDQLSKGDIVYLGSPPDLISLGAYNGQIRNGNKHGQGKFQYANIFLQGIFQNDVFTGKGRLFNDKYSIQGDFISKQNVKGKIQYSNGDAFQGVVDISTGTIKRKQGVYTFKDGDKAAGKFQDKGSGQLNGLFQYIWANGMSKKFDN